MPFCIKCGKENNDGAKFCTGCGTPMINKEPATQRPEIHKKAEKSNNPAIIIGGILLLVILGTVYMLFIKKDKADSVDATSDTISTPKLPGLYPHASQRVLNYEDISNLGSFDLRIMRNEIYARHGYIFQNNELINYFNSQSWYTPRYNNVTDMLSETEKRNIEFIKSYER